MFLACSIHAQTVQQLQAEITQLKALQAQVTALQASVSALQHNSVQSIAPYVSVDFNVENGVKAPNITFHGANIHIVNGSGSTASTNGLGNLIIGYDESSTTAIPASALAAGDRGGSHNLVMGSGNKFTTWASSGIVNGDANLLNAREGVILTGNGNRITGNVGPGYSQWGVIVTGTNQQLFDGQGSAIVGGVNNDVENLFSVILGGNANKNDGIYSTLLGGINNFVVGYVGIDQDLIVPDIGPHSGIKLPTLQ
jgi:hypothetical protein